jgi:hypothetical protein
MLRVKFDYNLAPKDWNCKENNRPDVVFMELCCLGQANVDGLCRKKW